MKHKPKDVIDIQDAMDNIAAIVGLDEKEPGVIGIDKGRRIVTSEEEFGPNTLPWLLEEGAGVLLDILGRTYLSIHQHLIRLYEGSELNWESERSRKGLGAMMELVGESARKMESYLALRLGQEGFQKVTEISEFKSLQNYYAQFFAPRFAGNEEGEVFKSESQFKHFEEIQRDRDYELFYIRNEDGAPYFTSAILREIRLHLDWGAEGEFEEDPLLKVAAMEDRDLHATAGQILERCEPVIFDFYKLARKRSEQALVRELGMAILALFLAGNPRYLLQNTVGKSCKGYMGDFHLFLRRSMQTTEYQKLIAYPPDPSDKDSHLLLHLVHSLCRAFYERVGGVKLESMGLIHRSMRKGEEIKQGSGAHLAKGETVWTQSLLDDEKFRTHLEKFPNGPLFKILDLIREEQEGDVVIPFDPTGQENFPMCLFELTLNGKRLEVLKLPSPTRQSLIYKAEVIDEFRGFLRSLVEEKPLQRHLLINLQDRTSWKEGARAKALEGLQKNAEFSQQLIVLTLPKDGDFYHQTNEYLNLNNADAFMKTFLEQLQNQQEERYFFSSALKKGDLIRFAELVFPCIHEHFFHSKNTLTRRNREDFIEIFYLFFILKCIDLVKPHSISFTCKDGIDVGSAQGAALYAFLKIMKGEFGEKSAQNFFRWLLYTPALFIRERAIDPERFTRILSPLERLDGEFSLNRNIIDKFAKFYQNDLFSGDVK